MELTQQELEVLRRATQNKNGVGTFHRGPDGDDIGPWFGVVDDLECDGLVEAVKTHTSSMDGTGIDAIAYQITDDGRSVLREAE